MACQIWLRYSCESGCSFKLQSKTDADDELSGKNDVVLDGCDDLDDQADHNFWVGANAIEFLACPRKIAVYFMQNIKMQSMQSSSRKKSACGNQK